ncbi:redoxin domain-containing protein [Planomicrobium sp. CPCC 101110]|uniref:redoxin domain-containing protein n=1 Tax=Planomicrobium sp. CPCC 101110 TaxID=2599619 RepID=UPI0011B3D8CD|nr:redoxin domain-containing protein [Planomicrobium sp. CPCC 101110]TWT26571.1 redoxin domain-containing protein [Planomicrobium sp. CPCC 101110]
MEKKKKRLIYRVSVLGLLATMMFYAAYSGMSKEPKTALTSTGDQAPNFAGETLTDEMLVLSNELEEKTLINFWGTWCEPCKREMPALENAHTKYKKDGFKVISINLGQSDFVTEQFTNQYKLTFPVLIDKDGAIKEAYHVGNLPVSFLVDKNGLIEEVHEGELSEATLEEWIN